MIPIRRMLQRAARWLRRRSVDDVPDTREAQDRSMEAVLRLQESSRALMDVIDRMQGGTK